MSLGTFADPGAGHAHFAARLTFETDPADVRAAQRAREAFVLVDCRSEASWRQGRLPGAVHIPTAEIAQRAPAEIALETPIVVYCWGPACNGSTKAAFEFSRLGYRVKEMIGGFEYWAREGFAVETDEGKVVGEVDGLTAPRPTARSRANDH